MNAIYRTGKKYLGKDVSKTQNEKGCTEAVNFIIKEATGKEAGGGVSTIRMYNALLENKNFQNVVNPQLGDIIISPTNGQIIGHTGIISDKLSDKNFLIMSNRSSDSLWSEHLTLSIWRVKYRRLPTALFRLVENVKIETDIERQKISILQKIVAIYQQIILITMQKKFGAFSSSVNPEKLSGTIKAIVASLLPVIHLVAGVELVNEQTDKYIDAIFLLVTGFFAVKNYIRSKRTLGARIAELEMLK